MKARISYEFFKGRSFYISTNVEFSLNGLKREVNDMIWEVMKHPFHEYYICTNIQFRGDNGRNTYPVPIHAQFVYLIKDTPKYTEFLNKLEELY